MFLVFLFGSTPARAGITERPVAKARWGGHIGTEPGRVRLCIEPIETRLPLNKDLRWQLDVPRSGFISALVTGIVGKFIQAIIGE